MQQTTAFKTVNFAASFSCALKRFGDANVSGREMILIGQFFPLDHRVTE